MRRRVNLFLEGDLAEAVEAEMRISLVSSFPEMMRILIKRGLEVSENDRRR